MLSINTRQLFFIISIVTAIIFKLFIININLVELCELKKKPFIFGEDLCNDIHEGNIQTEISYLSRLVNIFGPKVIIQAKLHNKKVVLKRLGTKEEFELLDSEAKSTFRNKIIALKVSDIKKKMLDALHTSISGDIVPKFHLCPKPKNVNKFLNLVFKSLKATDIYSHLYIWTVLKLNAEPLIFQILTPPIWPVPKYYGSCGRLAAFEDCGEMLTSLYDSPWSMRANLSHQLLSAAFKFTFDHPDFAFYLTDISGDNIVMDIDGKVKFIDLENIIVLDKTPATNDGLTYWFENHTSESFDCTDCFSYSIDDICSHRISDHNVYAVCKEILSKSYMFPEGFLYSPPKQIVSQLNALIYECVSPPENKDRFEIALSLKELLSHSL